MLINKIIKLLPLFILLISPLYNACAESLSDNDNYVPENIHDIIESSNEDLIRGRFNSSFEKLSLILPMAIEQKDTLAQLKIYRKFGVLYGKFGQKELSLENMYKTLNLAKQFKKEVHVVASYHAVAAQLSEMTKNGLALQYLDSCYSIQEKAKKLHYIEALYAKVYLRQGKLNKSSQKYNSIKPYLPQTTKNHQVDTYANMAKLKLAMAQKDSSQYYFEKALTISKEHNVHPMIQPTLLKNLAELYFIKGDKTKAYSYMRDANIASDSIFNILGENNRELFKLKSKYSDDILKKEQTILEQGKLIEAKDKASFRMKLLIAILILAAAIAIYSIRMRFKVKNMAQEQNLNKQKNKAVLETKNKELAVNALQLIEKEHTIDELFEAIKDVDAQRHKLLKQGYEKNSKKLWDDFHDRFTQINNQFYERLLEINPGFTPTELKHCSLIKLNFDSKEMAQILGISQNSVHMSRSRIRKKLNLNREDSLSNYIAKV